VTEEEIEEEYEKSKDRFYLRETLPGDDEGPPEAEPAGQEPAGEEPGAAEPPGGTVEPREPGQLPQPEETPAPDQPSTGPAEQPAQGPQDPAGTDSSPAPAAEEAVPGSTESDQSSSGRAITPFLLASYVQESDPSEEPASETPEPVAEPAPAEATPAEPPTTEAPPAQPPAAEALPAETPAAEPPPAEGPALGTTPAEEPGETLEGVVDSVLGKYVPLEKVKDEIRRRLARPKTATKIRGVFDPLRNRVMDYRNELIRYRVDSEGKSGDEAPPPPAKPDLQALAKSSGLTVHRAKLLSALDVAEEDIGRSSIVVPDAEGTPQQIPFRRYAYAGLPEYRPEISQDVEGDHYLFWIVEDSEERVPEFEEKGVRDGVLRAWKMVRARSLAEQEGQRLAAEAGKAKKSLKEAFAGKPGIVVNESEPFTWLTYGSVSALFARNYPMISPIKKRITDPQGAGQGERDAVVMPGNEFMRAVYNLKQAEIGLAMNHPKTAVYVVQLMETNPLPDVLWGRFLAESYYPYYLVDVYDRTQSQEAWLESIKSDAGLKWERDPREYRSR